MTDPGDGMKQAPFNLPVSFREWALLAVGALPISLYIMGLAEGIVERMFLGPISVAEAIGLLFAVVWFVGVIGPMSPFRMDVVADE